MATTKLKDLKIGFTDQFFFDTNIWMLLFGTVAGYQDKAQQHYSKLLEDLITKDSPIFMTSMVLSEFSNVILRRDYNQWVDTNKFANKNFKRDFVGTDDYKKSVETVTAAINKILKLPNLTLVGDNFNAVNKENILANFKIVDFNDAYYAELARLNNYKIVTHDGDFQKLDQSLDVITVL